MTDYESLNRAQGIAEVDSFTPRRYAQFAKCIPKDAHDVLDVGSATGRGGAQLSRLRPMLEIDALDCLSDRLAKLPKGAYRTAICALATSMPVQDNSYDAILAGEFLEHLTEADARATVGEFWRLLRPNGLLILTTPNPEYFVLRLRGGSVIGGAHLSQYQPRVLRRLLSDSGFAVTSTLGSGRVSRILGQRLPLPLYGSYLMTAARGDRAESTHFSAT